MLIVKQSKAVSIYIYQGYDNEIAEDKNKV